MKNKHRIVLALMASLSLLTFGAKNTNAKSNNSTSNQAPTRQAKIIKKTNRDLNHLPKNGGSNSFIRRYSSVRQNLKMINKSMKHSKEINNQQKVSHHRLSVHHLMHFTGTKDKEIANAQKQVKHDEHLIKRLDHKSQRHNGNESTVIKHHNNHHVDNNQQNIGGMNQFTNTRAHYLYNNVGGNTRDLGGYPADNDKYQIAPDRIIRSADLDGLSQSGLKTLKHLHVNKVIDLRYYTGKDGIQGHPDPSELRSRTLKGSGIDYQMAPVYTHTGAKHLSHYMKQHGERGEYYYYGNLSVSTPQAIKTYRKVFHDLLNNQHGAILFHCNLGRDRTGVTSALILSALGVNRNVIYHDYLLTYRYHYHFSANNPNYPMHAAELQYFFKTINTKYGSVKAYLSSKIGLNHAKLMKLRKMYLVPKK